ncbi:MAG: hypothetical protein ACKO2Y_07720 [Actinomycetota bacterium]
MRLRPAVALAALGALALGPAAADAQKDVPAAWSAPSAVSDAPVPAGRIADLQVVVDEAGTAVYVWRESDGAKSRVRSRACTATACTAIEDLSDTAKSAQRLAVAQALDGTVTAVWEYQVPSAISARARTGGAWGPEAAVNAAGLRTLQGAAALANGGLVVASTRAAGPLELSACTQRLAVCTTSEVSTPAATASIPQLDANGADRAALAWVEQGAALTRVVRYAAITLVPNAVPVAAASVAMSADSASTKTRLAVDVDKTGVTTVAWVERDAADALLVQRFAATAPPAAPPAQPVFTTAGTIADDSLQVQSDDAGGAVVLWATVLGGAQTLSALPYSVLARGTQQAVTTDGQSLVPQLAMAGTGTAAVAAIRDGQVSGAWAATPAGVWTAVAPAPVDGSTAAQPSLAAPRAGQMVLAWVTSTQANGEQTIRTAQLTPGSTTPKPTLKVVRRAQARGTVSTRVTASATGSFRQVGRITVRGRSVVACRVAPLGVAAGKARVATCRLTRAATAQRRRAALRIRLVTTFTADDGQRATATIVVKLARRR